MASPKFCIVKNDPRETLSFLDALILLVVAFLKNAIRYWDNLLMTCLRSMSFVFLSAVMSEVSYLVM